MEQQSWLGDPDLALATLALVFVGLAGWQGGKLVFEHQMGVMMNDDEQAEQAEEEAEEERSALPGVAAGPAR